VNVPLDGTSHIGVPRILCALFVLGSAASAVADPANDAKNTLNRVRAAAGLGSVELDPALSAGCMKHTEYLRLNQGTEAFARLGAHDEQPDMPGASSEGAACAKAADIAFGQDHVPVAGGFLAGIYHRRPMLDPTLAKIGVGYSKQPDGKYIVALRFAFGKTGGQAWPVRYPVDHQVDVPFDFIGETPNPAPTMPAGYPITLQFPPFDRVSGVRAELTDDTGQAVSAYLSDPEHPATSFPQLGLVSLIAKHPLLPDTTYTVTIEATWRGERDTWKWQFKTVGLRMLDAADRGAVQAARGVPSRVHGTVTSAGTIDKGRTVFLTLGKGEPTLSVIVPIAVWRELAGDEDPRSWVGRTVDVQATPQRIRRFINLEIRAADQLQSNSR
jgi:hypothetical protein